MGYRKISNLYKNKDILLFKQAYAMEKIHGTSAHIKYKAKTNKLIFFSGAARHDDFVKLFDENDLLERFNQNKIEHNNTADIVIYGEAYGGKLQAMSKTYGPDLKFIGFEVQNNNNWLGVRSANYFIDKMELEFVHYDLIDVNEESINAAMMTDSVQAIRNGMGPGHMREGIVLRSVIELIHPNGGRIISKHKRPEFAEREHTPKFSSPEELKILEDAKAIAEEWCVYHRLEHVLQKLPPNLEMKDTNKVINAMVDDIFIEAKGEIIETKEAKRAIGKQTVKLFKQYLNTRT